MANSSLSLMLPPAQKRSMSEDSALRLRTAILEGQFSPGERLRENELAGALGVSRGPIREALVKLEREGLVIIRPHRGAFVARLSLDDLEEVFTLRLAIEQLAVSRCVQFGDGELANRLDRAVAKMDGAVGHEMSELDAADLDLQLHDLIYEGSRHKRVQDVWSMIRPQIHILLLNKNILEKEYRQTLLGSHKGIVDAIRASDLELALQLVKEHLEGSFELVKQSLAELEESMPSK